MSDSTRSTKNAGMIAMRCSQSGASRVIGFAPTSTGIAVRSPIHAEIANQIAIAAITARPSRISAPGRNSAFHALRITP